MNFSGLALLMLVLETPTVMARAAPDGVCDRCGVRRDEHPIESTWLDCPLQLQCIGSIGRGLLLPAQQASGNAPPPHTHTPAPPPRPASPPPHHLTCTALLTLAEAVCLPSRPAAAPAPSTSPFPVCCRRMSASASELLPAVCSIKGGGSGRKGGRGVYVESVAAETELPAAHREGVFGDAGRGLRWRSRHWTQSAVLSVCLSKASVAGPGLGLTADQSDECNHVCCRAQ
jgi:hypothetical protein